MFFCGKGGLVNVGIAARCLERIAIALNRRSLFGQIQLLRPLADISLATWDFAPFSQHQCIKDMLPMKIYPYLSYRREINETDVNYT